MNRSTISQVLSVERLSTTMTSWGITVCRIVLSRQSAMRSASFQAGMTIETFSMGFKDSAAAIHGAVRSESYTPPESERQVNDSDNHPRRYNGEP